MNAGGIHLCSRSHGAAGETRFILPLLLSGATGALPRNLEILLHKSRTDAAESDPLLAYEISSETRILPCLVLGLSA